MTRRNRFRQLLDELAGITDWELYQVLTTDLAKKATFYGKGGKQMSLEAVRKLYQ